MMNENEYNPNSEIPIKKEEEKIIPKKKVRKKLYFLIPLIFAIIFLVLFIDLPIKNDPLNIGVENLTTPESLCSKIVGTPSWANSSDGSILGVGYLDFGETSTSIVYTSLIPNEIIFIYVPQCPYCQEQVRSFGTSWKDYVDSGLTVDCSLI